MSKNAASSAANVAGCSSAGKCPPRGTSTVSVTLTLVPLGRREEAPEELVASLQSFLGRDG